MLHLTDEDFFFFLPGHLTEYDGKVGSSSGAPQAIPPAVGRRLQLSWKRWLWPPQHFLAPPVQLLLGRVMSG